MPTKQRGYLSYLIGHLTSHLSPEKLVPRSSTQPYRSLRSESHKKLTFVHPFITNPSHATKAGIRIGGDLSLLDINRERKRCMTPCCQHASGTGSLCDVFVIWLIVRLYVGYQWIT